MNKLLIFIIAAIIAAIVIGISFDEMAILWQRSLSPDVHKIFDKITHLGKSEWILIPLGALCLYFLILKKEKTTLFYKSAFIGLSVALSGIIIQAFKYLIGRARPSLFEKEGLWSLQPFKLDYLHNSMPSGHSTTAFAFTYALALLFPRFKIPLLLIGAFIAFTRVIVGAHYPSDVFMGGVFGITITWLFYIHFKKKQWL
jgi:undecaprenyl-diphosphatase